jgi:hypothetical protein
MCEQAWVSFKKPAKIYRRAVTSYRKEHPTQKPVDLMEWCLGFLPEARTILDPFMGSGHDPELRVHDWGAALLASKSSLDISISPVAESTIHISRGICLSIGKGSR